MHTDNHYPQITNIVFEFSSWISWFGQVGPETHWIWVLATFWPADIQDGRRVMRTYPEFCLSLK
jgi:hypothetical protein